MARMLARCPGKGADAEECECGCPREGAEADGEVGYLDGASNQGLARMMAPTLARTASPLPALGSLALAGAQRPVLARGILDTIKDRVGDALDMRENEEELDCKEEVDEFRKKSFSPLANHKPTTGFGMFDVALDPKAGKLTITLKLKFDFKDGDPTKVSKGFKPEEFKWTDAQKNEFKTKFRGEIGGVWGGKHTMKSTKPGCWSKVTVATDVVITEADPGHFNATVTKYPDDAGMIQSSVCDPGTEHDPATGNCKAHAGSHGTGEFDSNDLRQEQKLVDSTGSGTVPFGEGSSAMSGAGTAALTPLIAKMTANANVKAEITGHSSTKHKRGATPDQGAIDNMDLARARTASVSAAIQAGGIAADRIMVRNVGEDGASDGKEWCKVEVSLSARPTQQPGVHESGHMFGLDDEYPTSAQVSGGNLANAKYRQMVKDVNGSDLAVGRTDGIMSSGGNVEKHNYVTFLEALKKISGEDTWGL